MMMTTTQISLTETTVAVLFKGRWEIYSVDADGLESFSHYAAPGEALAIVAQWKGGFSAARHYAALPQVAANMGLA